jgi:hypothetical protein
MEIEINESELQLLNLYRELDSWGFGELYYKWNDNKVVKISATYNHKPTNPDKDLTIIAGGCIIRTEI